jgi:hypothetical protein
MLAEGDNIESGEPFLENQIIYLWYIFSLIKPEVNTTLELVTGLKCPN